VAGKALGYTASFVSDTVSEKFYQLGDHFYSFGANWGITDAMNWFSGKTEAQSFLALKDKKTAALVVASPAIGLVAFRILTGALGCGAKGMSKAAEFAGYDHLKQPFERMGDDLISFATKKIETDLKVGAALTGVAAAVLMLKS
jgi:hypothetical protein